VARVGDSIERIIAPTDLAMVISNIGAFLRLASRVHAERRPAGRVRQHPAYRSAGIVSPPATCQCRVTSLTSSSCLVTIVGREL
jgi:hypothetical protein